MNKTFIIGNLTQEPERVDGLNRTLCKLHIAVNERYTDSEGNKIVNYFNVATWGTTAENCLKYLKKGSKIVVIGRIQNRSWQTEDGTKRYALEIVADEVEFISTPEKKEDKPDLVPIQDEDLPF